MNGFGRIRKQFKNAYIIFSFNQAVALDVLFWIFSGGLDDWERLGRGEGDEAENVLRHGRRHHTGGSGHRLPSRLARSQHDFRGLFRIKGLKLND